jgi:hypothetical protein
MEKELKIGQNVRTVDFKRTRAFQFKSAAVWNWECPKLLKTVVTEPHHKLEPHFLQFNVECQEFEKLNAIESIWEYRLLVMVLAKNGKPYRMASCTFNATDPIDVMWEKILNTIHSSAKSVDSFQKFVNTVWDGKSPTVFRLDDNLIKTISESVTDVFEAKTDIEKELDVILKLKPSQLKLNEEKGYDRKWLDYVWRCPNVLSQLILDEDWELRYGGTPTGVKLMIRIDRNEDRDAHKSKYSGYVSFTAVDDAGGECSSEVNTEEFYDSPTNIVKEIVRFMKIVCKDMESFRTFANHIWEPGYRQRWGSSLNEICRKITGQKFGNQYI